jgi:ATP-dependent Clp protease adapter protein ClpS
MNRNMNLALILAAFVAMVAAFTLPSSSVARKPFRTSLFLASQEPVVMMPATLEKEKVRTRGPALLERPKTEEKRKNNARKERSSVGDETWEVRIYNDGMNTREHVARALVQITGLSEFNAYQTMMRAHQNGIAAVGRWRFEIAEMYNDGLRKNGIISDIVPVDDEQ